MFFTQSRRRELSVGESLLSQFTKDEKIFSGMISFGVQEFYLGVFPCLNELRKILSSH